MAAFDDLEAEIERLKAAGEPIPESLKKFAQNYNGSASEANRLLRLSQEQRRKERKQTRQ